MYGRDWGVGQTEAAYFARSSSFDRSPSLRSSRARPIQIPVTHYGRSTIGPAPPKPPAPLYHQGSLSYRPNGPRSASLSRPGILHHPTYQSGVASVTERFESLYREPRASLSQPTSARIVFPSAYHSRYPARRGSDESSDESGEGKDALAALRHRSGGGGVLYQSGRGTASSMPEVPSFSSPSSRSTASSASLASTANGFHRTDLARSSGSSSGESSSGLVRRKLPPTPSPERETGAPLPAPVTPPPKETKTTATAAQGGLVGLANIGNTCFMNSVLQCLANTKALRDLALSKPTPVGSARSRGAVVKAFGELMEGMWSKERRSTITPSAFKSALQTFAPRFSGYGQHDSQEFLRYLLWGLHDELNTARPNSAGPPVDDALPPEQKAKETWARYLRIECSPVGDIFVGQLRSDLKCTACGFVSSTFDPFWDLSLPIPAASASQSSLDKCLASFTKEEVLDGDEKPKCERCRVHRKCTKKLLIQRFPPVLVLHLKRFSGERFRSRHSALVTFPLKASFDAAAGPGVTAPVYHLYAVSNHSGTPTMGHYTAYARHPEARQWHLFDDSRVATARPDDVVTSQAYVLFYQRQSS